jgi:hypothetical protein
MNEQDEEHMRCLFAMFKSVTGANAEECFRFADEMIEVRKVKDEAGIAGIGKRKYSRKVVD